MLPACFTSTYEKNNIPISAVTAHLLDISLVHSQDLISSCQEKSWNVLLVGIAVVAQSVEI